MTFELATPASGQKRDRARVGGWHDARRTRRHERHERMAEPCDRQPEALVEVPLVLERRQRRRVRRYGAGLFGPIEPRAGWEKIQDRPAVADTSQRPRKAQIERSEIDQDQQVRRPPAQPRGVPEHDGKQWENLGECFERTQARPAARLLRDRKARRSHALAADPLETGCRHARSDARGQSRSQHLARCLAG